MKINEIMALLESYGNEKTKKIYFNHGMAEPMFGVKVGDLRKIVKNIGDKNTELGLALFETGNYDAMALSSMIIDPKEITKQQLIDNMNKAYCYMLAEYSVAGVAGESVYGRELANFWINSDNDFICAGGWNTYIGVLETGDDIDLDEIDLLLSKIEKNIHSFGDRQKYTMNAFVIAVGKWVLALRERALEVASAIGEVKVNMGKKKCSVPLASEYLNKIIEREKK